MATNLERRVVKIAALVQGVALVTFPATSTIFTNPKEYGLTSTAYGAMFVPQAVAAIAATLLGARWSLRVGPRRVYLTGLVANIAAMGLLVVSQFAESNQALAYALLLCATASLGVGFGLTVPALNTFTAAFNPDRVDGSILVLNAILGLGTALAPLLVAVFDGIGWWWGLPLMTAILLVGLYVVSSRLSLAVETAPVQSSRTAIPSRFWIYAGFALCYGVCETMNGNWASLDMTQLGASTTAAAVALSTFWACVTLGRVLFAAIQRSFPTDRTYRVLPWVLVLAFIVIANLPSDTPALGILAFGLAGLGCSALLPLTISFGEEELVAISASVAGGIIAFYQLGYGIAAFGAGPIQHAGVSLDTLYAFTAIVAAVMGVIAIGITSTSHARRQRGLKGPHRIAGSRQTTDTGRQRRASAGIN